MMPLCTSTTALSSLWWGWAFSVDGSPWVAQRVWPMPQLPLSAMPPSVFSFSSFRRPFAFTISTALSPSRTARPAES